MEKTSYPEQINLFFKALVLDIREALDPDFIIITGSFGKDSWLYSGSELISDFELAFVCENKWSIIKKKNLIKIINNKYPYDISLKGYLTANVERKAISNYSTQNSGYLSLDFFDSFQDAKYLYVKNQNKLKLDCDASEVPSWEAWRLYVNRMADILKLECSKHDKQTIDYYWLKIFVSTADAYCIVNKIYDKNVSSRLDIFNKKLIEEDKELTEICKDSFPIIESALKAREKHDLKFFKIDLKSNDYNQVINAWMDYFQKRLAIKEGIIFNNNNEFYKEYLNKKELQKKYLGFNYKYNLLLSNGIRLIYNPKLLGLKFKFYNQNISWRHTILLSVSSVFREHSLGDTGFQNTEYILSKLINKKDMNKLNRKEIIQIVLNNWKFLR